MTAEQRRPGPREPRANLSAWPERLAVALLALAGCAVATYLTLYQWHLIAGVWDPIFGGRSSEAVLTSAVSRALPVPDATLGALAYAAEALLAIAGGPSRSSTAPWLVALFALVLAALAATAVALVLSQLFIVHALCTLCLCSACISFVNAWLGRREAGATLGALWFAHDRGESLWQTFWKGTRSVPVQQNAGRV